MYNDFHYAITLAQTLYDIEGDTEELEDIGMVAYNFIGNKNTELIKVILPVNCKDNSIELPCDVHLIEAVTYCGAEDWNYTSNTREFGEPESLSVENYIEGSKAFLDPHYISGKFVKYRRAGNKLYINKGLDTVVLLYHRELLDENDLPRITEKEAIAIADYIAYVMKYKEAIRTNNANAFQLAATIKQQWLFHCDAARVADYVNQNEMDSILNVQSSWGRKTYNRSYKPLM